MRNSKVDFIDNHEYNIVVYDHESEHSNQLNINDSFALILLHKLAQKIKSVSFLIGGFVNFNSKYQDFCLSTPLITVNSPKSITSPSSCVSSLTTTPISSNSSSASIYENSSTHRKNLLSPMYFNGSINEASKNSDSTTTTPSPAATPVKVTPKIHAPLTHSISHYDARGEPSKFILAASYLKLPSMPMTYGLSVSSFDTLAPNCTSSFNFDTNPKMIKPLSASAELPQMIRTPTKILNFLYLGSQEDALSQATMNVKSNSVLF